MHLQSLRLAIVDRRLCRALLTLDLPSIILS
jgi:hypothetical protein